MGSHQGATLGLSSHQILSSINKTKLKARVHLVGWGAGKIMASVIVQTFKWKLRDYDVLVVMVLLEIMVVLMTPYYYACRIYLVHPCEMCR